MPCIIAGSVNGKFPLPPTKKLEVLSVTVNNACNLACRHCYLEAPQSDKYMTRDEWVRFLASAIEDLRPTVLSFVGKEPLLNRQGAGLLFEAVKLRNQIQNDAGERTDIGVITNGTLFHKHLEGFLETPPDYIDISIDGLPETHDAVRGRGTFEQIRPNLLWLRDHFEGNVWLTHTLLEANAGQFPEFVRFYHEGFGLRHFAVGFYRPLWYTDQSLNLWRSHVENFAEQTMRELERIPLDAPVEVVVQIDRMHSDFLEVLADAGLIDSDEPLSVNTHALRNGLTVRFFKAAMPVGLWRSVRVTPEGYWLAAEDVINAKEYEKHAVARLSDHDFDAKRAYHAGLASDRFLELISESEHLQQTYPPTY